MANQLSKQYDLVPITDIDQVKIGDIVVDKFADKLNYEPEKYKIVDIYYYARKIVVEGMDDDYYGTHNLDLFALLTPKELKPRGHPLTDHFKRELKI